MLLTMAGMSKPIIKPAQATTGCIAHGLKRVRLQAGKSQTVPLRTSTQQPQKAS